MNIEKIKQVIKKKPILHLSIILFFIFIAFVANRFPAESFVGVGDFYQMLNPEKHFDRNLYMWFNQSGQGRFNPLFVAFPFYTLLALFSHLGLGSAQIASLIIFLFCYFSFLSMYFALRIIFPNLNKDLQVFGSLLYALNNFTITVFTYSWGFSHHFLIYIFIPLLIALFYKIFIEKFSFRNLAFFALMLILSTVGFNNIAFFLAISFLQLSIFVLLLIFKINKPNKEFWLKVILLVLIYLLVLLTYFVVPTFLSMREEISQISNTSVWGIGGLRERLKTTSSTFLNSFFLSLDGTKYPFKVSKIAGLLSTLYLGIIIVALLQISRKVKSLIEYQKKEYSITLVFLILFLLLIALSVRSYGIFSTLNLYIYQLPIINTFRSPDKIFMMLPFVMTILIVGLLRLSSIKKKFLYPVLFLILLIPYPFYTGEIVNILKYPQLENGYRFSNQIPEEYKSVADTVNADEKSTTVISLPYAVVNSLGWSNYYKWHYVGADPIHLLFDKYYISANDYDHPLKETLLSFREYEKNDMINIDQFLSLVQSFSGEYIIFHKDIDPKWLDQTPTTYQTLLALEKEGKISEVKNNDLFVLFRLNKKYIKPVLSTNVGELTFRKVNPIKYELTIKNIPKDQEVFLKLNQSYNSQWHVYDNDKALNCNEEYVYTDSSSECKMEEKFVFSDLKYIWKKSLYNETHKLAGTYANSWVIKKSDGVSVGNNTNTYDANLVIFFTPQVYLYLGILINSGLFVVVLAYLLLSKRKNE